MEDVFVWSTMKNDNLLWWGVDFDGTICNNTGAPNFIPTTPIEGAVEALQYLDSIGYKITIFTSRPWAEYNNIERWCEHYSVPVRRIICGKPLMHVMYDDRNFGTTIDWNKVIKHYEQMVRAKN